jgi:hypothetical protein
MIFFESIEKWTSLANSHHLKGIPAESPSIDSSRRDVFHPLRPLLPLTTS